MGEVGVQGFGPVRKSRGFKAFYYLIGFKFRNLESNSSIFFLYGASGFVVTSTTDGVAVIFIAAVVVVIVIVL